MLLCFYSMDMTTGVPLHHWSGETFVGNTNTRNLNDHTCYFLVHGRGTHSQWVFAICSCKHQCSSHSDPTSPRKSTCNVSIADKQTSYSFRRSHHYIQLASHPSSKTWWCNLSDMWTCCFCPHPWDPLVLEIAMVKNTTFLSSNRGNRKYLPALEAHTAVFWLHCTQNSSGWALVVWLQWGGQPAKMSLPIREMHFHLGSG